MSSNITSSEAMRLSRTAAATQSTVIFLVMIASLICNALVGFVIVKKPQLLSHSASKLLLNLIAASFLLSFTVLPFAFASSLAQRWLFGEAWCSANGFLTVLFCSASLETVMFLSIDRYHCIVNSLNYPMRMSPTRTHFFIAFTWLASLFLAILPLAGWGKYGYQPGKVACTVAWGDFISRGYSKLYSIVTLFVPLLVMVIAYYHILKAAHRQARVRQVAVLPASIARICRNSITSNMSTLSGCKALRTTFLVLGTVLFCWGPYVVAIFLESEQIPVGHELQTTFVVISYSSTLLYPIIYGFHMRVIRRKIKQLVSSILFCGTNSVRPSSETGFLVSPPASFRHRSASEGSVNSLDLAWSPRRESEILWGLPAIREERVQSKSTELTDLELYSLPGQVCG